jgi:hypothetical protein
VAIFLMNVEMSMCVGQAFMHGESKQYKQRLASITAEFGDSGGWMSAKFFSYCSGESFGAGLLSGMT